MAGLPFDIIGEVVHRSTVVMKLQGILVVTTISVLAHRAAEVSAVGMN